MVSTSAIRNSASINFTVAFFQTSCCVIYQPACKAINSSNKSRSTSIWTICLLLLAYPFVYTLILSHQLQTEWRWIFHCHCLVFVAKLSILGCWQNLSASLFIIIHVKMKTLSVVSRCHVSLFIFSEEDFRRLKQMTLHHFCLVQHSKTSFTGWCVIILSYTYCS